MESLFEKARKVIEHIEQAGFEAYIVGGAVRDSLLKRPVHDIDIATSAYPAEIIKLFPKTFPTGLEHGTVLVRYEQESFEITTFRKETGYTDFRRPDKVTFVRTLKEDLARRDFTINAMAFTKDYKLIDPFGGKNDLTSKIIRTVGSPSERFQEDGLRMMRAIRFSAQLGFKIEQLTLEAIKEYAPLLQKIAVERLAEEWNKIIVAPSMRRAFLYLKDTKTFTYLPVFQTTGQAWNIVYEQEEPFTNIAEMVSYLHLVDPAISIANWMKDWKLSNAIKKDAKRLVSLYQSYSKDSLEWIVYQLPDHLMISFNTLLKRLGDKPERNLFELKQTLPIQNRKELAFNGNDLLQLFPMKNPGAWIEQLLSTVERHVVMRRLENNKKTISEWLKKWDQSEIS